MITTIDESVLKSEVLSNPRLAASGHLISDCPFCGKPQHLYIQKIKQVWDCKKCGENGNLFKLLKQLGKLYLLKGKLISVSEKLKPIIIDDLIEDFDYSEPPLVKLPVGFKRSFDLPYLVNRGFEANDFEKYVCGTTSILPSLDKYVVIGVEQNKENKGYIARHTWSKEKISKFEQNNDFKIARYKNSKRTKFNKLLMGLDEVSFQTDTAILVEGFFDKRRTDKLLKLDEQQEFKCLATFGKAISNQQIMLMLEKGFKDIILVQDPDAVEDSKKTAFELSRYFNTFVGFTTEGDLDECSEKAFFKVFDNLMKPVDFTTSHIQVKKLH